MKAQQGPFLVSRNPCNPCESLHFSNQDSINQFLPSQLFKEALHCFLLVWLSFYTGQESVFLKKELSQELYLMKQPRTSQLSPHAAIPFHINR